MSNDDMISIPSWAWKWALGFLQAGLLAAIGVTSSWAWSAESRVARLEARVVRLEGDVESQQSYLDAVTQHETAIQVMGTKLEYISSGVDEVKAIISKR